MQDIKVSIIQSSLFWEDHNQNRQMFEKKILSIEEDIDIIILPEMFSTGFSMEPAPIAEKAKGDSFLWMQKMAKKKNAVVSGSIATKENGKYYNRFYWVEPGGKYYQYDKKHLFTFAGEHKQYTAGAEKIIINFKGWKIMPLICYDLRFPVWSKNNYSVEDGFDYDCLLYVANWPQPRSHAWRVLLMSRAIENQSYVIGVNRVGTDSNMNDYSGDSAVINPRGENISSIMPSKEMQETIVISYEKLKSFRQSFKLGPDWDKFTLE